MFEVSTCRSSTRRPPARDHEISIFRGLRVEDFALHGGKTKPKPRTQRSRCLRRNTCMDQSASTPLRSKKAQARDRDLPVPANSAMAHSSSHRATASLCRVGCVDLRALRSMNAALLEGEPLVVMFAANVANSPDSSNPRRTYSRPCVGTRASHIAQPPASGSRIK